MKNWASKVKESKGFLYNFLNFVYKIRSMSFARYILVMYILITIIGALLLWAPFSQTGNLSWDPITGETTKGYMNFTDSLFTAASSFSDTGLITNTTPVVYNEFGQAIISILIFVGGLGFFALKVFIFNIVFNRPISFRTRESLAAERGNVKIGVTRSLISVAIITLLTLTVIFSIILSTLFYYTDVSGNSSTLMDSAGKSHILSNDQLVYKYPFHNSVLAVQYGIFHTISALNNAGFDIISNTSLSPYYYVVSIQIIFIILFVIGGMGYPVIYDIYSYITSKATNRVFRFSLFTKLSVTTYFLIVLFGIGVAFGIETTYNDSIWKDGSGQYGSKSYKSLAIIFNTMSTRNAGFSTVPMHSLSHGTLILYIILMFIGSAPSSTAGGIRTTTFAIVILGIISVFRGRKSVHVFRTKISGETVRNSYIVLTTSIALLIVGSLISLTSLQGYGGQIQTLNSAIDSGTEITKNTKIYSFTELAFEVGSAFGTTGLSTGITSSLSIYSKFTLILIMLIGQLGVSSSLLIWGSKRKSIDSHYRRISTGITIG